jgi:hypothetical protein
MRFKAQGGCPTAGAGTLRPQASARMGAIRLSGRRSSRKAGDVGRIPEI